MVKVVTPQEIKTRWAELYPECVNLKALKDANPEKFRVIKIQLRDILMDIEDALKEITLDSADIDFLAKVRDQARAYAAIE